MTTDKSWGGTRLDSDWPDSLITLYRVVKSRERLKLQLAKVKIGHEKANSFQDPPT